MPGHLAHVSIVDKFYKTPKVDSYITSLKNSLRVIYSGILYVSYVTCNNWNPSQQADRPNTTR